MLRTLAGTVALALALTGCATTYTQMPAEDRAAVERQLKGDGTDRVLRLSYYVTPFFGDPSKKLLTPLPPDEVQLINNPSGEPVYPGSIEGVLPAGTLVRIRNVEFPTAYAVTERVLYTPRHMVWVYLQVDGQPNDKPFILPMRPTSNTQAEFLADLERYVSRDAAERLYSEFSEGVQAAIKDKSALIDMPSGALEMAWGYPERKKKWFEESNQLEEWIYPGGKRMAYLTNGRVTRTVGGRSGQ